MKIHLILILCVFVACVDAGDKNSDLDKYKSALRQVMYSLRNVIRMLVRLSQKVGKLQKVERNVMLLTKHIHRQQTFYEETVRSNGMSGVKQNRVEMSGSKSYYSESHGGKRINEMHDHGDTFNTIGLGEFIAVMNGVQFRTRHNDFHLAKPKDTKEDFPKLDDVPYPDVPPSVLEKKTIPEQAEEMRQYFKAFHENNTTIRADYTKYFKSLLCYMEGHWTTSDELQEPFESSRHFIDAAGWEDLHNKVEYLGNSGGKEQQENMPYLPSKLYNITKSGTPQFANWIYRIACHPTKNFVPPNRLKPIDDIKTRISNGLRNDFRYNQHRGTRFQINPEGKGWTMNEKEDFYWYNYLDELMEEIPGLDGYKANLQDVAYESPAYHFNEVYKNATKAPMNTARYHRYFRDYSRNGGRDTLRKRGFSDDYIFMAMNTQDFVAPTVLDSCITKKKRPNCGKTEQRWSYAIPLEIVYMTPLPNWNPYNITYHGEYRTPEGKVAIKDGRDGSFVKSMAFNGTNSANFYITPAEFFSGLERGLDMQDKTDTGRNLAGVLDQKGNMHKLRSSGTKIILANIEGVGAVRLRYPISPVHGEGSGVWKELNALKDAVTQWKSYPYAFIQVPQPGDVRNFVNSPFKPARKDKSEDKKTLNAIIPGSS